MSQPTLHRPIPMNSRVMIPKYHNLDCRTGTVIGVSSCHVIYIYIILLDSPIQTEEFGEVKAVNVSGCELEDLNGQNWRL